jgi:heme A synthase
VTAGVFATSLGAGEIVVAGSAQGASWVSGTMTLALIAPLLLGATTLLVGNPLVFGSALAIFGSTALVGILLYRRADRKARDEI